MIKKIEITKQHDADRSDTEYWLSKTPKERLQALEILRKRFFGYDDTTGRFQRIIEIVKRK